MLTLYRMGEGLAVEGRSKSHHPNGDALLDCLHNAMDESWPAQ